MSDAHTEKQLGIALHNLAEAARDVRRLVARLDERIAAAYLRDEPHAVAELERVREDVQEVLGWL